MIPSGAKHSVPVQAWCSGDAVCGHRGTGVSLQTLPLLVDQPPLAARRRDTFIRLESFGSSQPSVKACLRAAGCFLAERIPTATGSTSHHTHGGSVDLKEAVYLRDKHLMLTTGAKNRASRIRVGTGATGSGPESSAQVWGGLVSVLVYAALIPPEHLICN